MPKSTAGASRMEWKSSPPGSTADHGPDRDAARVEAVGAGGEHAVAHLHVGLERHVLERETVAAGAAHDALAAGALDHRARRRKRGR